MTIKDMGQNVSSDLDARPLSLTLHRNRTQISFILIFFLFFFFLVTIVRTFSRHTEGAL